MAMDFNTSLRLLAEWGDFLDKTSKDLDAKLAKQSGNSAAAPPDIQVVEESVIAGKGEEKATATDATGKEATAADDTDDWMDELVDDDSVSATEPPPQTSAAAEVKKSDVIIF